MKGPQPDTEPPPFPASPAPPMTSTTGRNDAQLIPTPSIALALHTQYPDQLYSGAGQLELTPAQIEILRKEIPPETVEIRPDGMIYWPEMYYRERLDEAFKPGGWALRPLTKPGIENNVILREFMLVVNGKYASQVHGASKYNDAGGMDYGDALESCRSNGLTRSCKDLRIAWRLWTRAYIDQWIANFATEMIAWHERHKKWEVIWVKNGRPCPYPWNNMRPKAGVTAPPIPSSPPPVIPPADKQPSATASKPPPLALQAPQADFIAQMQAQLNKDFESVPAGPVPPPAPKPPAAPVKPSAPSENYTIQQNPAPRDPSKVPGTPQFEYGRIDNLISRTQAYEPDSGPGTGEELFSIKVNGHHHNTKNRLKYQLATAWRAKGSLVRVTYSYHQSPKGLWRKLLEIEEMVEGTGSPLPPPPPPPPLSNQSPGDNPF